MGNCCNLFHMLNEIIVKPLFLNKSQTKSVSEEHVIILCLQIFMTVIVYGLFPPHNLDKSLLLFGNISNKNLLW